MPTVDGFCWALQRYVGYREKPPGTNNVPGITDRCGCYATWCAWCYMTLSVAYTDAGGQLNEWSVPHGLDQARAGVDGFTFINDPYAGQRGDFMVIAWGGRGRGKPDHIEGVVGVMAPGDYHTVGGNVADRCDDWHRNNTNVILGFIRPPYTDQPTQGDEFKMDDEARGRFNNLDGAFNNVAEALNHLRVRADAAEARLQWLEQSTRDIIGIDAQGKPLKYTNNINGPGSHSSLISLGRLLRWMLGIDPDTGALMPVSETELSPGTWAGLRALRTKIDGLLAEMRKV